MHKIKFQQIIQIKYILFLKSSQRHHFIQDPIEFLHHVWVVYPYCQLSPQSVIFTRAFCQFHVLFFCSHVVVYDHLHVQLIVPLLLYSLLVFRCLDFQHFLLHLFLDHIDDFFALLNFFDGLFVPAHLTENRSLVQVSLNDFIFFLTGIIFKQVLFYLNGIRNSLYGQVVFLFLLVNAGQVVESQNLYVPQRFFTLHILPHIWNHQQIHSLRQQSQVHIFILFFEILHRHFVYFQHKVYYFLGEAERDGLNGFPFQTKHGEMKQFFLIEQTLNSHVVASFSHGFDHFPDHNDYCCFRDFFRIFHLQKQYKESKNQRQQGKGRLQKGEYIQEYLSLLRKI